MSARDPSSHRTPEQIRKMDRNYSVTGDAPVMANTGRDCDPQQFGWRHSVISTKYLRLPYVSYWNGSIEFYVGWRPSSGGLGFKLVRRSNG